MTNQKRNNEKFNDKNKGRVYVIDEVNKEFDDFDLMNANDYDDHEKNYYANKNNKTHDQDDYDIDMILYILKDQFQCRQCKFIFEFNNLFHKHLRQSFTCLRKTFKFMTLMIIKNDKNLQKSFANIIKKSFANIFAESFAKQFFINVIKRSFIVISSLIKFFIKHLKVDFDSNIEIDYDFKDWSHVKTKIVFFEIAKSRMKCLNIDAESTIIDRSFLKK